MHEKPFSNLWKTAFLFVFNDVCNIIESKMGIILQNLDASFVYLCFDNQLSLSNWKHVIV